MQKRFILNSPNQARSPVQKLLGLVFIAALLVMLFMFSAVLLVVIAVVGTIAFAYVWWKTREVRKQMRMMQRVATPEARREAQASNDGVFEGEVIRVVDPQDVK